MVGTRLLDVPPRVDYSLTGNLGSIALPDRSGRREVKEQNRDVLVGLEGRASFGSDGAWFVPYYVDLGTGESRLKYQLSSGIGYTFGWGDVVASWRYLDYRFKAGKPIGELSFNGPQIAVVFRW